LAMAAALPEVVFHGLPAEIAESPRPRGTSAYVNAANATVSIDNTSDIRLAWLWVKLSAR
jgi:hypothetical protein